VVVLANVFEEEGIEGVLDVAYRLYMSDTMSISASAAAIFCSDVGWGRPPKRKDMIAVVDDKLLCRPEGVVWFLEYVKLKWSFVAMDSRVFAEVSSEERRFG